MFIYFIIDYYGANFKTFYRTNESDNSYCKKSGGILAQKEGDSMGAKGTSWQDILKHYYTRVSNVSYYNSEMNYGTLIITTQHVHDWGMEQHMLVYHPEDTDQLPSQILDNLPPENDTNVFTIWKNIPILFYTNTLEEPASLWINGQEYPFSYGLNFNPQESEAPFICITDINNDSISDVLVYGTAYRTELRQDIYLSSGNGYYYELGDITWNKEQTAQNFLFNASLLDDFQVHITALDWNIEETGELDKELTAVLVSLGLYEENSNKLTDYGYEWKKLNHLQGLSIQYAQKEDGNTYLIYDTQIEAGYNEYCIGYGFRFEYLIQDNNYILHDVLFMDYTNKLCFSIIP